MDRAKEYAVISLLAAVFMLALVFGIYSNCEAMDECQRDDHSYNYCMRLLNK